MLRSHVVLRQSLRTASRRLISTAIAAPPRPRGRPKKCTSDEVRPPPRPRGRPRKNSIEPAPEPPTNRKRTARPLPEQDDGSSMEVKIRLPVRSRKASTKRSAGTDSVSLSKPRKEKVEAVKGKDVTSGETKDTKVRRTRKRLGPSPMQGAMQHDHDHLSAPRISLLAPTTNHHDLVSFLEHSRNIDSKPSTTVYRGTHYEYTVIEFLKTYNFTLRRTGRSNDLGIDLLGQWLLPSDPQELRVLVQCKASKPRPAMVRELEGAYVGAPAGWRGADVMALLVTRDSATLGVRNALQRSRLPMGFAQITENGLMRQFMWNHAAQEARLTGMSVTNEYRRGSSPPSSGSSDSGVESAVSLQWMGKRWNDSENVSQTSI